MTFTRARINLSFLTAIFSILLFLPSTANAGPFDKISYSSKTKPFSEYSQVYIDIVDVSLDLNVRRAGPRTGRFDRPVSERDQSEKANDLHNDLINRIGNRFELADRPGPGILTLSATITELKSSRPTIADYSQQVSLSANSVYVGGAAATFVLSENGQELATISDKDFGSFNDGLPRIGIWSDTDRAFGRWGRKMAKFLAKN